MRSIYSRMAPLLSEQVAEHVASSLNAANSLVALLDGAMSEINSGHEEEAKKTLAKAAELLGHLTQSLHAGLSS